MKKWVAFLSIALLLAACLIPFAGTHPAAAANFLNCGQEVKNLCSPKVAHFNYCVTKPYVDGCNVRARAELQFYMEWPTPGEDLITIKATVYLYRWDWNISNWVELQHIVNTNTCLYQLYNPCYTANNPQVVTAIASIPNAPMQCYMVKAKFEAHSGNMNCQWDWVKDNWWCDGWEWVKSPVTISNNYVVEAPYRIFPGYIGAGAYNNGQCSSCCPPATALVGETWQQMLYWQVDHWVVVNSVRTYQVYPPLTPPLEHWTIKTATTSNPTGWYVQQAHFWVYQKGFGTGELNQIYDSGEKWSNIVWVN